ncbi:UPF0725 protein At1g02770 isoform X2 [Arabidopsis lyrata subsp. lyrata]|uniref:UPF0725 protein At1g02770 isoform X2 n=1 Tax=Arabidopsis lyrata subsp. lyrata TaxID=81972 RepID=UPI000A29E8E6|nr:UPF0725 protein At1g02770 isoform X2 [Arabidopsis lyrata subsp. lyrata]|eukprot:XP_020891469.1 UPF0725 protein At1g02770 isoform X2 [Arabidopsis lyrata subsp. lyrata]
MSTSRFEEPNDEEYARRVESYWRQVYESDCFDIEGVRAPPCMEMNGLITFNCLSFGYPDRPLVNRYARLGLHRYNMKEGTNFELDCLIKFNKRCIGASSYWITLAARDTVARSPMQTFQVQVDEKRARLLDLTCSIARVKGETTTTAPFSSHNDCVVDGRLPDWPVDAFDGSQRFYLKDLSKLKIVKVAIETTEEEPLKAKNSILYIAFKGLATGGIGEHVERKAIIKSGIGEHTGFLYLKGNLCRGEEELTPMSVVERCIQYRDRLLTV